MGSDMRWYQTLDVIQQAAKDILVRVEEARDQMMADACYHDEGDD